MLWVQLSSYCFSCKYRSEDVLTFCDSFGLSFAIYCVHPFIKEVDTPSYMPILLSTSNQYHSGPYYK